MTKYTPTTPPDSVMIDTGGAAPAMGQIGGAGGASPPAIVEWIRGEFERISRALGEFDITTFKVLNVAPPRPREGSLAFADGTNWNPGAGRGMYEYRGGAWQKL